MDRVPGRGLVLLQLVFGRHSDKVRAGSLIHKMVWSHHIGHKNTTIRHEILFLC